jgi:Zn-dependent M28 family amino/carboxypeptidase
VTLLEERFRDAGWRTQRQAFEVRDTARHYGRLLARYFPDAPGVNVVAQRVGARRPDDLVVVGAHHDTLPTTPGADDNGAGLVALLTLARLLADVALDATVALVAFDHEEIGFHGARHYVWQLPSTVTVRGALIYETMAYVRHEPDTQRLPPGFGALFPRQVRHVRRRGSVGDFDAVIYRNRARVVAQRLAGALAALEGEDAAMLLRDPVDLPVTGTLMKYLLPPVRNLARSDHVPFWDADLPAIQVTDTANFRNPHYHQPSDRPDTVDLERLAAIVAATAVTVERTAGRSPSP